MFLQVSFVFLLIRAEERGGKGHAVLLGHPLAPAAQPALCFVTERPYSHPLLPKSGFSLYVPRVYPASSLLMSLKCMTVFLKFITSLGLTCLTKAHWSLPGLMPTVLLGIRLELLTLPRPPQMLVSVTSSLMRWFPPSFVGIVFSQREVEGLRTPVPQA